jgi:hypothetical protein
MEDRAAIIAHVCEILSSDDFDLAADVIKRQYPFQPIEKSGRRISKVQIIQVFVQDGFIDRYRGTRLVFPPALRLISEIIPDQFPYHKNGKLSLGHFAYWELFPSVDHVVPVARGGADDESNWVCCSMLTNQIKANWTLDELGWKLQDRGDFSQWDGMLNWFVREMARDAIRSKAPKYCHDWLRPSREFASW